MSSTFTVYIGAYLQTFSNKTTEVSDYCAGHDIPKNANYCPICGRNTANRFVNVKTTEIYSLLDDMNLLISVAEKDNGKQLITSWLPIHIDKKIFVKYHDEYDGEFSSDLSKVNRESMIEEFKNRYGEILAKLADANIKYSVNFGVIGYFA